MRRLHGPGRWRRKQTLRDERSHLGLLGVTEHFARPGLPDLCEAENFAGENEWGWEAETEAFLETEAEADL